jgi:hypothetical protein
VSATTTMRPPAMTIVLSRNPEQLMHFYRHVLGADVRTISHNGTLQGWMLQPAGSDVHLRIVFHPKHKRSEVLISMHCSEAFRRAHRELVCLAATTEPLRSRTHQVSFCDPEGTGRLILRTQSPLAGFAMEQEAAS